MSPARSTRPTIRDVAERAGVSKMAVSLAVNNRPGVSDATRQRILTAAEELGWRPNSAARSLSAASPRAVGLVLRRSVGSASSDTFYMQLFAGLETGLRSSGASLLLHLTDSIDSETEIYKRLAGERRVDAVLLTDLEDHDSRIELVRELGLSAVALGGPADGIPVLVSDDAGATKMVVDHLADLGHEVIARVGGPDTLYYVARRNAAFARQAHALGIRTHIRSGAATPVAAATMTRSLLHLDSAPTAIVYDSDLLALAGIAEARAAALEVPHDLSVVAWDGSFLGEFSNPPLTTLRRDVVRLGEAAAHVLIESTTALDFVPGPVSDGRDFSSPHLVVRGTTAHVTPSR